MLRSQVKAMWRFGAEGAFSLRRPSRNPVARLAARILIVPLIVSTLPPLPAAADPQVPASQPATWTAPAPPAHPQPLPSFPQPAPDFSRPALSPSSAPSLLGLGRIRAVTKALLFQVTRLWASSEASAKGPGAPSAASGPITRQHTLPAGWNLVSVPLQPVDGTPTAVFDEVPPPLRLYDYGGGQTIGVGEPGFRNVAPGRGYWLLLGNGTTVGATGNLVSSSSPFTISLAAGWNVVATPWLTGVEWTDARVSVRQGTTTLPLGQAVTQGWIDANVETYDPSSGGYVVVPPNASGELAPWQGYLLYAHAAAQLIFAPPPPDNTPPVVAFISPAEQAEIALPTAIVGTADDDNLVQWDLTYSFGSRSPFRPLASGTTPVVNGTLATLDPTLLQNGPVVLRLTASDAAGNTAWAERTLLITGGAKIGLFRLTFQDLQVPLVGIPITIYRVYDSRDRGASRDFGFGWTIEIAGQGRYTNNRKQGDGWVFSSGSLPCQGVSPTKSHVTEIRFSDQEIYRFAFNVTTPPGGSSPPCLGRGRFLQVGGRPGAKLEDINHLGEPYVTLVGTGSDQIADYEDLGGATYEPADVRLTTRDGRQFDLHITRGLTRIADTNGNSVTITPNGITHSSGRSISIARDGLGRVTQITDPAGNGMTYAYDGNGDLVTFTNREAHPTTFIYSAVHPHLLDRIQDARGIQPVRTDYDADGRLISTTDAFGKVITFNHDIAGRQEIVTDRLGNVRVMEYDQRGNIVRETDPLGHVTTRTFDTHSNPLTETNPLGHTTTYTYDASDNVASEKDALGGVVSYTYNSLNRPLTMTDARGKVTTLTYDASGNLLSTTDPLGNTKSYTRDMRGNVLTQTDALGNITHYEYDGFGNVLKATDALGAVTAYTYDANGNRLTDTRTRTTPSGTETLTTTSRYDKLGELVETVDPEGGVARTVYDAIGKQVATVDALSRTTSYEYDEMGRRVKTTHPDGMTEETSYDAENRPLTTTDRAGRTTSHENDPLGRVTKSTRADGSSVTTTYDKGGQVIATADARGNTTSYEYDAAGRRTKVTDSLGGVTVFTYDANGNQVSMKDPRGTVTTLEYDGRNVRTRILFQDGSEQRVTYDALGRRTTATDQAGKTTRFAYDDAGRLAKVTDALGQVTTYSYDELGNRVSQTDANGRVTRFDYSNVGRLTQRTLPGGAFEVITHDAAGNPTSRTDFAGRVTSYAHDVNDRLTSLTYPDGTSLTFTYTPTGHRATVVDARGTTTYSYDLLDRLTAETYPDGRKLTYGYDAHGNRTSVAATIGAATLATTHAYDAANRLSRVMDPLGRIYTYGYDANGNRASLNQPNGTTTTYAFNALNRLMQLSTQGMQGIIQSYALTLGPAGNRTQIAEADGTVRSYTYDELYRLTGERVTGPLSYEKTWTYDPVSNRLMQTTIGNGAPGTPTAPGAISYTYDERDRLITENLTNYTWDPNGNLVTKSGEATYTWDFEDRLTKVVKTDGTVVEHAYDADGNRVQTKVTPPTGPTAVTNYLVDTSGSLSQVVAETNELGFLGAYYVRGDDLLAIMRPAGGGWSSRFYHADALGSIRRLTDEAGNVTDTYTYTAFGEVVAHTGSDSQPYAFAGESYDPNVGFAYHRARWLDPRIGRFVGMDPWPGVEHDPTSLHKYLYVAGDPLNKTDPTGLDYNINQLMIAMAVIGVLLNLMNLVPLLRKYYAPGTTDAQRLEMLPDIAMSIFGIFLSLSGGTPFVQGFSRAGALVTAEGHLVLAATRAKILGQVLVGQGQMVGAFGYIFRHWMEWELNDSGGGYKVGGELPSGGLKPGRRWTWPEQLHVHTERKVLDYLRNIVRPGDILELMGTKPPCNPGGNGCQNAMKEFAKEMCITIIYRQEGVAKPWIFMP